MRGPAEHPIVYGYSGGGSGAQRLHGLTRRWEMVDGNAKWNSKRAHALLHDRQLLRVPLVLCCM